MHFVIYRKTNGEILRAGSTTNVQNLYIDQSEEDYVLTDYFLKDQQNFYVQNGDVVPKLTLQPTVSKTTVQADDIDTCVISNLPDPVEVWVDDTPYNVTGGTLELASPMKGPVTVEIKNAWPYLPWALAVEFV